MHVGDTTFLVAWFIMVSSSVFPKTRKVKK